MIHPEESRAPDHARRRVLGLIAGGALTAAAGGGAMLFPVSGGAGEGKKAEDKEGVDAWARHFLSRHRSIDTHAHPGRFFLEGLPGDHPAIAALGAPRTDEVIGEMREGGIAAAVFSLVADLPVLAVENGRIMPARDFRPGEARANYRRQLALLKAVIARTPLVEVADRAVLSRAFHYRQPGAIIGVEGGDFLEGSAERVAEAAAEGVRVITLVHYRVNELADNQTAPPVHGGLSQAGRAVIRAMAENGILLDLAHASEEATRAALAIVDRPVLLSHTALRREGLTHPRLISVDHARMVAAQGGVIGVVPWGIGQRGLPDYVHEILRMVAVVGIDHVAIGTDMDATYRPVLASYRDWPRLVSLLREAGLAKQELWKLMAGNFLRVWKAWGR